MKKLLLILFIIPICIHAQSDAIKIEEDFSVYSVRRIGLHAYTDPLTIIKINNKIGYSISTNGSVFLPDYSLQNWRIPYYNEEDILYFSKVAYFGYGYADRTEKEYYMAAQQLIWERVSDDPILWSLNPADIYNVIQIDSYKEEILSSINRYHEEYQKKEEFLLEKREGYLGEILEYTNDNITLSDYEIVSSGKNEAWIQKNHLYIRVLSPNEEKIVLKRKGVEGETNIYGASRDHQVLAQFNLSYVEAIELNVQGYEHEATILAFDCLLENKSPILQEFFFRIYNIEEDRYIGYHNQWLFKTDQNGHFLSDFYLPFGKYEIQFDNLSECYQNANYLIEVKNKNNNFSIYFKEKTGNLLIHTVKKVLTYNEKIHLMKIPFLLSYPLYAASDIYNLAGQLMYHKGQFIDTLVSNSLGIININHLYAGKYQLNNHQFELTCSNMSYYEEIEDTYQKTMIGIENDTDTDYHIIVLKDIHEGDAFLPAGVEVVSSRQMHQTLYLPDGNYKIIADNSRDEKTFTIDSSHHQFYFIFQTNQEITNVDLIENKNMPDTYDYISLIQMIIYFTGVLGIGMWTYEKKFYKNK